MASATATLFAYATMSVTSYTLGKKHYAIPYNLKKIVLYLAMSIMFSGLSFYVFRGHYFIGILLILILITVIWIKEKNFLKQLVKS